MLPILLTKYPGSILGPIANILGYVMNGIFNFLDLIGIPNVGLAIILFTIVIYLCLLPLTIKQQKFSKLSAKMNPELQVIRERYKNKKDQQSMQAMNQETQQVYAKYGVSPSGSCVQLLIQMPILFALYRVIGNMPAYVTKLKEAFFPLVDNLITQAGSSEFIQSFKGAAEYVRYFADERFTPGVVSEYTQNAYIDVLYKASSSELSQIATQYPAVASDVAATGNLLDIYNNFLSINIGNSPSYMFTEAWNGGVDVKWIAVIAAFIIPFLAAATQWINTKLMPQQMNADGEQNSMAQSMKMMNNVMPLMSAFFCFSFPAGMGLYWVAGAVVRSIQQIIINKHIDKIDLDELIKKNVEKKNKKLIKAGIDPQKVNTYATLNTKRVNVPPAVNKNSSTPAMSAEEKAEALKKSTDYYNNKSLKPGSIASKANMVKQYNEKNNK